MATPPYNVALSTGFSLSPSVHLAPPPSSLSPEAADHESPPPCCASAEQKTCECMESTGSVEGGRERGGRGRKGGEGGREPETCIAGYQQEAGRGIARMWVNIAAQQSYRIAHRHTYCNVYHTIQSCMYTCTCTCNCIHLYTEQCPVMNVTSTCV